MTNHKNNRVSLQDLIDCCQSGAIANKLLSNEETVYRKICRDYSTKYHTPLHIVMSLDPEHVILTVFEGQLDEIDVDDPEALENMVETLNIIDDPNYESSKESELQRFIDDAEKEEEDRLDSGKPIHKAIARETSIKNTLPEKPIQKNDKKAGGYLNLSYLEAMDKDEGGEF